MKETAPDILLIESNPYDVEITMREFEAHDFARRVMVLRDGNEALQLLLNETDSESAAPGLRAILVGWKLSKLDGLEVVRRLKNAEQTRRIPIFLLLSSPHDVAYLAKQPVRPDGYLIKPVSFDDFIEQFGPAVVRRSHNHQVTFSQNAK